MTAPRTEPVAPATVARAALLRLAIAWHTQGQINQALSLYTKLLDRHPGSPEANEAVARILEQARAYEEQGRYQLALDLYQKMERLG